MSAGHADDEAAAIASDHRLAAQGWPQALLIGAAQILALLPGISHSGATMTAGLLRGLTHQDAARFAFLVATPVIAATGLLKPRTGRTPPATPSSARCRPAASSPASPPTCPCAS